MEDFTKWLAVVPDMEIFKGSYYFQNSYASNATIHLLHIKAMPMKFNIFGLLQKCLKT